MKKPSRAYGLAIASVAFGALIVIACAKKETTTPSASAPPQAAAPQKPSGRNISDSMTPSGPVKEMNDVIFSIKSYTEIDSKVDALLAIGEKYPEDSAVQTYMAALQVMKFKDAKGVEHRPLKGILWKLGGFVIQSEQIYGMIISSFRSIRYNSHLYSNAILAMLGYFVFPDKNMKRFDTIHDAQNHIANVILPAMQKGHTLASKILAARSDVDFIYDRALFAGEMDPISEKDRYAKFIRPYLVAGLANMEYIMGSLHLITAYNLDALPDFLNKLAWESVKGTVLTGNSFLPWGDHKGKKFKNLWVHTPYDYKKTLSDFDSKKLFFVRTAQNGGFDGSKARAEALEFFQRGSKHDVEFVKDLQDAARLPNQDDYILNHEEFIHIPAYKLDRVEKIASAFEGKTTFSDPLSGKEYNIDIPRLFMSDEKNPGNKLSYYYPTDMELPAHDGAEEGHRVIEGQTAWEFSWGKPKKWADPTFNGFLPDATNDNLLKIHRALTYSNDFDVFAGVALFFVI